MVFWWFSGIYAGEKTHFVGGLRSIPLKLYSPSPPLLDTLIRNRIRRVVMWRVTGENLAQRDDALDAGEDNVIT